MKEYRAKEGRFSLRLHYDLAEIDTICLGALREANMLPSQPQAIEIDRFLESYWGVRLVYEDHDHDTTGSTVFSSKGRVTGFTVARWLDEEGSTTSDRRLRSTLAHEGGHGLLHQKLFIADPTPSLFEADRGLDGPRNFLCRSSDIQPVGATPYNGQWWEWQANLAIGGLLLPIPLVRKIVAPFTEETRFGETLKEYQRVIAERELAEVFDVNPVVARIRLAEMFPQEKHPNL